MIRFRLLSIVGLVFLAACAANYEPTDVVSNTVPLSSTTPVVMTDTPASLPTDTPTEVPAQTVIPTPTSEPIASSTPIVTPTSMLDPIASPTNIPIPDLTISAEAFCTTETTQITPIECDALMTLYTQLDGENWYSSNWLQSEDYCAWHGISCTNGYVTALDLESSRLIGDMPPEIGNLTNLTSLNFKSNNLSSVPPEIGNLTNLTSLNLRANNLSSLPPETGRFQSRLKEKA